MARLEPHLAQALQNWRDASQTIVFTNGVFDLLHPGHISQLQAAKAFGDILVVGLNSDASVKLLAKGEDRPIIDELARQTVLSELRCVDAVALFDGPTPLELIELIKPDVLVKGADSRGKEVVGQEFVEASGGRVELVKLVEGYSTTAIIERLRQQK